jgi:enoyl-CoA hydratase
MLGQAIDVNKPIKVEDSPQSGDIKVTISDELVFENVLISDEGDGIYLVTMNCPERLNALNGGLHEELIQVFQALDLADECKVMIVTGAGRAFSAGGNAKEWKTKPVGSRVINRARNDPHHYVDAMLNIEKPVIAMVNGAAVGQGLMVALWCDIVIASKDARLGDRHINFGLLPGDGGVIMLPLLLGMHKAKELLLTGDLVNGEEAARLGLVNYAVDAEELKDFTMVMARKLAGQMPYALKVTKATLNMIIKRRNLDIFDLSHALEILTARTNDQKEAVAAWNEKRDPVWSDT